jgi:hypothetical protein
MAIINELIKFKPKTKAVADDVNSNFEQLRVSNNEQEEFLNKLQQNFEEYQTNLACEIECNSEVLELNNKTNNYIISGESKISEIIGIENGFVFLEFTTSRVLVNSLKLKLQNNVDRNTKVGDVGIYIFENGVVKEINYFTSKEEKTNTFSPQTIIDAPRDNNGKSNFLEKVEFSEDIMPVMTGFEDETCIISSSSQYDATNYMAWKAFRHHTNDVYGWLTVNGVNNGWLKVEFRNNYPKITAFAINARNSSDANTSAPCDFYIEGSNDDVNWTLLGDYTDNYNWTQNEKRYFALTYFDVFKYYKITITSNSGGGTSSGFGALEFFETTNDFSPMVAKINISTDEPLLINTGIGKSNLGKINQLSIISQAETIENLYNNATMYLGYIKNETNHFEPFVTTACPVYSNSLQRYSDKNSVPTMISNTTSTEFKVGYTVSCSSYYVPSGASYPPYLAFNGNLSNKWVANIVGNNQWLQIDFPNFRKAARFAIVSTSDDVGGAIKKGYIKGFTGEEWVVLKEIQDEPTWTANEIRYYDVDIIENCIKFKLEFEEIQNTATRAQIADFRIYEIANCFVIPNNKFYSYNLETKDFEEQEIIYIGRIRTQNYFVTEVQSYAVENKYTSEETDLSASTLYSFFHNIGMDYKNLKISGWIKDKINNFILPWSVDSNFDSNVEFNNYGFFVDDCQFNVRTPTTIMNYKDYNNVTRTLKSNATLVIQIERNF